MTIAPGTLEDSASLAFANVGPQRTAMAANTAAFSTRPSIRRPWKYCSTKAMKFKAFNRFHPRGCNHSRLGWRAQRPIGCLPP